jgi:hypothetical protein
MLGHGVKLEKEDYMRITMTLLSLVATVFLFTPQSFAHGKAKVTGSAVIDFSPGQSTLTSADTEEIRSLIKDAQANGKIDKIEVAVWSDKEHPVRGDLSAADKKLAEDRAENIKNALKMSGNTETVKVFNMADGSNWLARTFRTTEAELDSAFAKRDAEIKREDFKMIKENGAPSKAVILVKSKGAMKGQKMYNQDKTQRPDDATDMSTD